MLFVKAPIKNFGSNALCFTALPWADSVILDGGSCFSYFSASWCVTKLYSYFLKFYGLLC